MHLLEPRAQPSQLMRWTAPLWAILAMLLTGSLLFWMLGKPPLESFQVFFIEPLTSSYGWSELLIKASPLILIAAAAAHALQAVAIYLQVAEPEHHAECRWQMQECLERNCSRDGGEEQADHHGGAGL